MACHSRYGVLRQVFQAQKPEVDSENKEIRRTHSVLKYPEKLRSVRKMCIGVGNR